MARDGVFDELDAALCWHPDEVTGVGVQTSLANCQVLYKFTGKAAHAGGEPHLGRSALDAVALMDIGANYLREHMIDQARVHYAITDTGGFSPNVVQPHAEVLYLIRAPHSAQVKELYERVNNIARGAELMVNAGLLAQARQARQEHRRLVGPEGYVCPIPEGVRPRSMESLHK